MESFHGRIVRDTLCLDKWRAADDYTRGFLYVFTYALLDALVNGASNNDGKIELSELVAHVQTLAPKLSREMRGGPLEIGLLGHPPRLARSAKVH